MLLALERWNDNHSIKVQPTTLVGRRQEFSNVRDSTAFNRHPTQETATRPRHYALLEQELKRYADMRFDAQARSPQAKQTNYHSHA